ncbi:MAG: pentapeptide repeat-containing protein [Desulfurellaceae bacterium]|nr:pentapeptide repeat-containing protein [Desulfurellaceae bacterium]
MNMEETLALYAQGKEAWNTWANELLARREDSEAWKDAARVEFAPLGFQEVDFSGFIFPGNALFLNTTFLTDVRFLKAVFMGSALFREVTFKGAAWFEEATFERPALFREATFERSSVFNEVIFKDVAGFQGVTFEDTSRFGKVRFKNTALFEGATFERGAIFSGAAFRDVVEFRGATFEEAAVFGEVRFKNKALFEEATFKGATLFPRATFEEAAVFGLSTFEHSTSFYGVTFCAKADFKAVQGNSVFAMTDAEFLEVPDFQQATFVQAPRLDNVNIESRHSRNISFTAIKSFFRGDLEKEGRWRALKRLATQGHDHASEQLFFRGELLARRGVTDRYWHASFWLGVFYQLFSDFGRALIRPLLWWAVGVLVFAGIYLSHYPGNGEWFLLECIAGTGKPWVAALGLSLHRSLPALSGFRDTLPQFHACLYGVHSESPFRPIIPDVVSFLSVPQVLFSAVMIFLFLLAVRNHFRIK